MREPDFKPITDERNVFLKDTPKESDMDTFNELFKFSLQEMARVYKNHRMEKGDSWKNCPVEYLRIRLLEEIKEWNDSVDDSSAEYNEITDILNFGFMLLERLAGVVQKK